MKQYKVVTKDIPEGVLCTLYLKFFFRWIRVDRIFCNPSKANDLINDKINWWDRQFGGRGLLIEHYSKQFTLYF